MRRVVSSIGAARVPLSRVPARNIQSSWGLGKAYWDRMGGKKPFSQVWKDRVGTRYWLDSYAPDVAPASFTEGGKQVYSEIIADIKDLKGVDWTINLDHRWVDQLERHRAAVHAVGPGGISSSVLQFFLRSQPVSEEEREMLAAALGEFEWLVDWALKTEAVFSDIYESRFEVMRNKVGGRTPIEREASFARDTAETLAFIENAPAELRPKIKNNLEFHLFANRHWTWNIPNVKARIPDYVA